MTKKVRVNISWGAMIEIAVIVDPSPARIFLASVSQLAGCFLNSSPRYRDRKCLPEGL